MAINKAKWGTHLVPSIVLFTAFSLGWNIYSKSDFCKKHSSPAVDVSPAKKDFLQSINRYNHLFTYIVKPGDTFAGILANFGIPGQDINACYSTLSSVGLSALYPGDSLLVALDDHKNIEKFSILSQLKQWYHVKRDSTALLAEKSTISPTIYRCILKGTLSTCLSQDMQKAGVGSALVTKLTDIFAWDINFFLDPQPGDRFELIFEKQYVEGKFIDYGEILSARYITKDHSYYAIGMHDSTGQIRYYDITGKSLQKQFLKAPLRFSRISSGFTFFRRHPVLGKVRPHLGIDYAAPKGTPVYAAADGVIAFCGRHSDYGNQIIISHGGIFETMYGHLNGFQSGIQKGSRVVQGQMIATVGSTGLSTGPHLDYRMKKNGNFVNPVSVVPPAQSFVGPEALARFEAIKQDYLSILDIRFGDEGCYVLDIDEPQPVREMVTQNFTAVTHD
jgi:murein DD-endopeptidase MepM/ murein hydrolase activator NlpD